MRPGARTATRSVIIPKKIRIFELLHDITIFPEVRGRVLLCPVLWARLVQQIRQAVRVRTWSSTTLGRFTFTPLAFVLHVGISHKIQAIIRFTLTVVSMAHRVVLLPLGM